MFLKKNNGKNNGKNGGNNGNILYMDTELI